MAAGIHQILRGLWLAHWCIAPGLVFGLKLAVNPDPTDPPLIPGNTIHVQSTPEQGDPAKVNLYIYNTVQNIRTELWVGLEPANSIDSLFEIPPLALGKQYVVRATQTSGEFLADSPTFEILAGTSTTSASSISSTSSGPSKSNTSTLSSSPSSASAPPSTDSSKQPPVGAIVGGVLGGLVLIVIILGLLVRLRRRRQNGPGTAVDHEKPWAETGNRQLEPFTAMQPPAPSSASTNGSLKRIPPRAAPPSSAGESISSGSEPTSSTPLSSSFPPSSSPPASDSKSARFATRSELERQKRRINQQMALIQNRSPASGVSESGSSTTRRDDADLRQELNDLRAQIRQLGLRQAQNTAPAWQDDTPEEPPPGYNR